MATKNIVPNADGEGQLGTSSKSWAQGHIDSITGTISTAAQGSITSLGTLTTLTVDDITIDGSTISDGGDITIDAAGGIILDADSSGTITIKDNTVTAAFLYHYSGVQSGDFGIFAGAADKDIYLQGSSGGSTINALHLDMSASGLATFSGNIKIPNDGTIGSAGTAGALTISSGGVATFSTTGNNGVINIGGSTYYSQFETDAVLGGLKIKSVWGAANSGIIQFINGTSENVRMHIADNGNVGIGTTSPSAKLQIHTATNAGNPEVAAFLVNESTTTNTEVRLAFAAHTNDIISTGRYSYISAKNTSGSNGQDLVFATNATGASATPKLTISSGGDVTASNKKNSSTVTDKTTTPYAEEKIYQIFTTGSSSFDISTVTSGYVTGSLIIECSVNGQFGGFEGIAGSYRKAVVTFNSSTITVNNIDSYNGNIGNIDYTFVSHGSMKITLSSINTAWGGLNGIGYIRVIGGNNSNNSSVAPLGFTLS